MSTLFLSPVNPPKTPHLKIDHMFMSCHDGHGLRKPFPDLLWWALRWASAGEGEGRDGVDMAIVAIVAAAVDVEMCLLYATEYRGICRRMCFWAAAGTMEVMTISRKRQGMQIQYEIGDIPMPSLGSTMACNMSAMKRSLRPLRAVKLRTFVWDATSSFTLARLWLGARPSGQQ